MAQFVFFAADQEANIIRLAINENFHLSPDTDEFLKIWQQPLNVLKKICEKNNQNKIFTGKDYTQTDNLIGILLVKTEHLQDRNFFFNLSGPEEYVSKCKKSNKGPAYLRETHHPLRSNPPQKDWYFPIITIGLPDIMEIYEESPGFDFEGATELGYWKTNRQENRWKYDLDLAPQIKFLDSSIWHRYVAYDDDFSQNLLKVVEKMNTYLQWKLYKSVAALSTLEFQCRMLQNSTIAQYGGRGHHEAVTPFKFHSETIMERKVEKFKGFFAKEYNSLSLNDLEWNLLLVDDYADQEIYTTAGKSPVTKMEIIKKLLSEIKGAKIADYTEGPSGIIQQATEKLKQKKIAYDIILLDYLIGDGEEHGHKAYGHELLLELSTREDNAKFHRGPSGRFWIYPISSFPFAFADKLRQLNIDGSDDRWHISSGGDPISTPALFQLNFYRLLMRQISEYFLHETALLRQFARYNTIKDLGQWCAAIKERINAVEQSVRMLATDRERNSIFAETMEDFLDSQKDYFAFFERIKNWLRTFSYYQEGTSPEDYWRDLANISDDFPSSSYRNICEYLKEKAELFTQNAADLLLKEMKKQESIEFSAKSLYFFPSATPVICSKITALNLSVNYLKALPSVIKHYKNLKVLDLSYNRDLSYLPASDMLAHNTELTELNLQGTALGLAIRDNTLIKTTKRSATRKLLEHIKTYNERLQLSYQRQIQNNSETLSVFISYAHQDVKWKNELKKHLKTLELSGSITVFDDAQIPLGDLWEEVIRTNIEKADVVLFLLSADLLASDYITSRELDNAIRQNHKKRIIVPVFLRNCDIQDHILGLHQGLPSTGYKNPILSSAYQHPDDGFVEVVKGLREMIAKRNLSPT